MKQRRGFVQSAILRLLAEQSMHGYQIMKELEERSGGAYSASAGTIYPALQELLDQNYIVLEEASDKKIYSINENGTTRIQEAPLDTQEFWIEWKERMTWKNSAESVQLRDSVERWEKELRKAIKQARGKTTDVYEIISLIDEMTHRLKKKSTQ